MPGDIAGDHRAASQTAGAKVLSGAWLNFTDGSLSERGADVTRRANAEGSIRHREDGRSEARITVSGRRRSFYGHTRESVHRKLTSALRAAQDGVPVPPQQATLASFWRTWLPSVQTTIRPATWRRYEQLGRVHILPVLGRVRLVTLTPQHVGLLHERMLAEGVSPTTVHHAHMLLHRALEDALRWGALSRNVLGLVHPPRMVETELRTLNPTQVRALCAAAVGDRFEALFVVAVTTGLRQGELLALRWRDVNLETATFQVTGTLTRDGQGLVVTAPKTARSRRQVVLSPPSVAALLRHRSQQAAERERMGAIWVNHDLVFPNVIGGPMQRDHLVRRHFVPLLRRTGLSDLRFHDLRHTAATLLLGGGVHPKIAAEMLGHPTVAITLNRYSHVTETMQREAARVMGELVQGQPDAGEIRAKRSMDSAGGSRSL
ncbi:MAG: tyrosine-type recombinase/integrase [Candidatus Dormibacteria bacterium]